MPIRTFEAMRALILCAVAATMVPTRTVEFPMMRNQRRPKISDRRPIRILPMACVSVYARGSQRISSFGPRSSLMEVRALAAMVHPQYALRALKPPACMMLSLKMLQLNLILETH